MNTTDLDDALTTMVPTATPEAIVAAYDFMLAIERRLKEYKALARERMAEWLAERPAGTRLQVGERYWYLGTESETWCEDVAGAVDALLVACEGDLKRLAECLSSNAVKVGASRKVLPPEVFGKLFKTEKREVLKDGKPVKQLIEGNAAFERR